MRKPGMIMLLFALALAACTSPTAQPVQEATAPIQAPATAPTAAASTTAPAEPTVAPVEPTAGSGAAPAPAAGVMVYKIVPGESIVTYEVGETFLSDNRFNLAVGKTPQISGDVTVDTSNPQNSQVGELQVDISQFQSDSTRRDGTIRSRFLESSKYPIAVFTPTSIEGLPASYTPGQELTFKVTGDLKIKEVVKPATFDVTAKADGDSLTGMATTTILMSDFGVGPIKIANMLGTEDQVKLTLNFVARP